MPRSYYTSNIPTFLSTGYEQILGILTKQHRFALEEQQRNAWLHQIEILKDQLTGLDRGQILFEYSIPRMGKRADTILILDGLVFILEFKLNETHYRMSHLDQCLDYALDLKYFHEESHKIKLVPILIATDAHPFDNKQADGRSCKRGDQPKRNSNTLSVRYHKKVEFLSKL